MMNVMWIGAVGLTLVGSLMFWGAKLLQVESLYLDSSITLGLALLLVGVTRFWI